MDVATYVFAGAAGGALVLALNCIIYSFSGMVRNLAIVFFAAVFVAGVLAVGLTYN